MVIERDFIQEMRDLIDEATSHGPYQSWRVAEEIVARLREVDPELLHKWLHLQAVAILAQAVNARDRSARAYARSTSRANVFASVITNDDGVDGGGERLARWLDTIHVVNSDNLRKSLKVMTGTELVFVADHYDRRAKENRMMAIFMRALERRVGTDTVQDHFTDEQLAQMWNSLQ